MEATASLLVIDGVGTGTVQEIRKPRTVLGRNPDCDICVPNLDASRNHAQILRVQDEFFLEDLHSTNGTFLNNQPVHNREIIVQGDRIRVGSITFEFHRGVAPGCPPIPTPMPLEVSVVNRAGDDKLIVLSRLGASSEKFADRSAASLQNELKALLRIRRACGKASSWTKSWNRFWTRCFRSSRRPTAVSSCSRMKMKTSCRGGRNSAGTREYRVPRRRATSTSAARSWPRSWSRSRPCSRRMSPTAAPLSAVPRRKHLIMCAPLIDGEGRSFGVLQLDGIAAARPFREEDLEIFVAVAIQTSIAIDNARLHEKKSQRQNIESERDFADRLLQGILPSQVPELRGYRFYQYYCPAANTGGDFYDYVSLYNGNLMVFMADTTGHGAAATMLVTRLALEIRSSLLISSTLSDMMRNLNHAVFRFRPQDQFIKMVVAEIVPASGDVTVVSAGHQKPWLCRKDGTTSQLGGDEAGLPLGVDDDADYAEIHCDLPSGGALVLHSDGAAQATDPSGQVYGDERIRAQVAAARGDPAGIGERLVADVRQFIGGAAQYDDICIVCAGRE